MHKNAEKYNDPREISQLIKGNFQAVKKGTILTKRSGWMIMRANREQFNSLPYLYSFFGVLEFVIQMENPGLELFPKDRQ